MNSNKTTQPSGSPRTPWALYLAALLFGVIAIAGTASAQCSFQLPRDEKAISYTFEPSTSQLGLAIHVILEFKGTGSGTGKLVLPSDWAGESNLEKQITNLKAWLIGNK